MARGINKVILIGNLGADPDMRSMPSGVNVANIRIATSETWKDKQSGESKERTEWHNVAFFGRQADIVGEYLKKGSKVYVEGSLRTRKWQDKQGIDRYTTEVIASEVQFLDSARNGTGSREQEHRTPPNRNGGAPPSGGLPQRDFDDDIPF